MALAWCREGAVWVVSWCRGCFQSVLLKNLLAILILFYSFFRVFQAVLVTETRSHRRFRAGSGAADLAAAARRGGAEPAAALARSARAPGL